jgi:hypothetical protein
LSDNFIAKEDLFQAKITLQNVLDNSKFPELVSSAAEKLAAIEAIEAAEEVDEEEADIEVELFNQDEFDKLFEEEEEILDEELPLIPEINKEEEETKEIIEEEVEETEDVIEEKPENE